MSSAQMPTLMGRHTPTSRTHVRRLERGQGGLLSVATAHKALIATESHAHGVDSQLGLLNPAFSWLFQLESSVRSVSPELSTDISPQLDRRRHREAVSA